MAAMANDYVAPISGQCHLKFKVLPTKPLLRIPYVLINCPCERGHYFQNRTSLNTDTDFEIICRPALGEL